MVRFGNPFGPSNLGLELTETGPLPPKNPSFYISEDLMTVIFNWDETATAQRYSLYYCNNELTETQLGAATDAIPDPGASTWTWNPEGAYGDGYWASTLLPPLDGYVIYRIDDIQGGYWEMTYTLATTYWLQSVGDDTYSEPVLVRLKAPPVVLEDLILNQGDPVILSGDEGITEFVVGNLDGSEKVFALAVNNTIHVWNPANSESEQLFGSPSSAVQPGTLRVNDGGLIFWGDDAGSANRYPQYIYNNGVSWVPATIIGQFNVAQLTSNDFGIYGATMMTPYWLYFVNLTTIQLAQFYWNGTGYDVYTNTVTGSESFYTLHRPVVDQTGSTVAFAGIQTGDNIIMFAGGVGSADLGSREMGIMNIMDIAISGNHLFYYDGNDIYRLDITDMGTVSPDVVLNQPAGSFGNMETSYDNLFVWDYNDFKVYNDSNELSITPAGLPVPGAITGMYKTDTYLILSDSSGYLYFIRGPGDNPVVRRLFVQDYFVTVPDIEEIRESNEYPGVFYLRNADNTLHRLAVGGF
jgi:hypothetical protein